MSDRAPGNAEMRTPAILSVGVHVFAIAATIVNFNFFNPPPLEPEPVMVEFEAIAKKAAAPKVGIQEQQPEKAKIADETSKAPPPKTAEPPPAPETPKPAAEQPKPEPPKVVEQPKPKPEPPKPVEDVIAMKPKEPEPPKVEKPPEPHKPEPPKPEVKKVEPPKPAPPKPAPPKTADNIIDSILKNDDKNPPIKTPQQSPQRPKEITRQVAMAPEFAKVVTASEVEGVRQKIRPCWNSFGGAKDAPIVTLVVQMNQNGTPVEADFKDPGRMGDPVYRAAAESAKRAILNPRCQPWPLSPEKYNSWRVITFNFDPRDY
jgi:hypothetical protein